MLSPQNREEVFARQKPLAVGSAWKVIVQPVWFMGPGQLGCFPPPHSLHTFVPMSLLGTLPHSLLLYYYYFFLMSKWMMVTASHKQVVGKKSDVNSQVMHGEQCHPCSPLPLGHLQLTCPQKPGSVPGMRGRHEGTVCHASWGLAKAGMSLGNLVMWRLGWHRILHTGLVVAGLRWVTLGFVFFVVVRCFGAVLQT